MDNNAKIRIQDDLYRAVNADWLANNEIPDDQVSWSPFTQLREQSQQRTIEILREVSADEQPLLAIPFGAFMDEEAVEAAGAEPIKPLLDEIENATDKDQLIDVMGKLTLRGVPTIFGLYIYPDDNDPSRYVSYVSQGGISLPDEAMYREEKYQNIRDAFRPHVAKMLEAAGINKEDAAERIFEFEKAIAEHHFTNVELRDTQKTNNPTTWDEVIALAPALKIEKILAALKLDPKATPQANNNVPPFLPGAEKVWEQTDLETLKVWLQWRTISNFAPLLSRVFVEENFDFFSRTLAGQPQMRSREKRAAAFVENIVGEQLGRLWVERHFPPENKAAMDELVKNLLAAYGDSIRSLDWMGEDTKKRALEKLATFDPKIGHPLKWKDYSGLDITAGDSLADIDMKATAFHLRDRVERLDKPVDRSEWLMTPQTVNAYYYPTMNEIVFPAAILQPPFFDINANQATNYGAIGAVIGHEIGHGFDDQGSQYGADGRIENWWTDEDRAAFEARTKALIEQYAAFSPAQLSDEYKVNGELTIGENIGDLGGLSIAVKAWEKAVENGAENPGTIQDLFSSWATTWAGKIRDEALIQLLAIDPHSPAEFRCNGVVRNMDAFYQAFDVQPDDQMWLDEDQRVSIW